MGFLMLAGLIGTIGYMGYYAKQETTAIIGDTIIQPKDTEYENMKIIENNFKLICKRGNAKLDSNDNPIHQNGYKTCIAYLQYQGFQQPSLNYFEQMYKQKYETKQKNKRKKIEERHQRLSNIFFDEYHTSEKKIFRKWDYSGDTQKKCDRMMNNWLWSHMAKYPTIVKDGNSNVEVWHIYAPPSILKQLDKIYDEVCYLEKINN